MRILIPVFIVIVLQPILYVAGFGFGGVFSDISSDSIEVFCEKSEGRMKYLETDMTGMWSNFREAYPVILDAVKTVLNQKGRSISDISKDADLNAEILSAASSHLLNILRKNGTTGVFMILNGDGISGDDSTYAGVFLRDMEPSNYAGDNGDVYLERGLPDISRELGLSFDSNWAATFKLDSSSDYFFKPFNLAKNMKKQGNDSADYGYWSHNFLLNSKDGIRSITYSVPLIDEYGTPFGVLGIDVTVDYIKRYLHFEELAKGMKGCYALALTDGKEKHYKVIASQGPDFEKYFGIDETISVEKNYDNRLVFMQNQANSNILASVQLLNLYGRDSHFAGDRWAVIGIVPQKTLLSPLYNIQAILLIITVMLLVVSIIVALFVALGITRPIENLLKELRNSDPHKPINLRRVNMEEIDQLSESIESLSHSVEESASRISKIITMTEIPLGVYEFKNTEQQVFCSESLFDVLGWEGWNPDSPYIGMKEFRERFRKVLKNVHSVEQGVYQVNGIGNEMRWVRIKSLQEGDRTLGAILDVTNEINEKIKIEYQRDYDVLTNLYNRFAFSRAMKEIARKQLHEIKCAAVIMLDLDNLKYVNDRYGHDCGDKYIQAIANCLRQLLSYRALVGRRSGDEFYALIYGYETREEIRRIISKIWKTINQEYILLPNGEEYKLRASAGIAWYPDDSEDFEQLVQYADFAMYNIKHTVKGNIGEFSLEKYENNAILLNGYEALNRLIEQNQVRYALQPIISTKDGSIFGYEMLMRPMISEFNSPSEVLRIAAVQAKLHVIEEMTVQGAFSTFKSLLAAGSVHDNERIFINSIGNQIVSPMLLSKLESEYKDLLPKMVLELTEDERNKEEVLNKKLEIVRRWGSMLALDDYGTGYNRESAMTFIIPDIIKLDISFVRGVDKDFNKRRLIQAIMAYAKERNIYVLAEGVETKAELEAVVALGVDFLQGYYIARPEFEGQQINPKIIDEMLQAVRNRDAILEKLERESEYMASETKTQGEERNIFNAQR